MPQANLPDGASTAVHPALTREETYTRDILTRVHANEAVSQRSIAREMGIALGLANLLLRRMANRGLIRLVRVRPNRVLYFITPTGLAEKARMTVAYVARNVQSYRDTRDRIRARFAAISRELEHADPSGAKSVVFYGADEVAEIGYVCLHDTDLELAGVVAPGPERKFFGVPVRPLSSLSGLTVDGQPYGGLVVMSLSETDALVEQLRTRGVPPDRVFWLL
jgi:hypothetical protein